MDLIVDSGSTKAEWVALSSGAILWKELTAGLNALTCQQGDLKVIIKNSKQLYSIKKEVEHIYFYGAGCMKKKAADKMSWLLLEEFPEAIVEVQSDLLGASRAVEGPEPFILSIFGTGSAHALYSDGKLEMKTLSLGYLLGDELGGSWIGKHVLRDYLRGSLPREFNAEVDQIIEGKDSSLLIRDLYSAPRPNRFLAKFARPVLNLQEESYSQKLLNAGFDHYYSNHLSKYKEVSEVRMVGSVAFLLKDFLEKQLTKKGLHLAKVLKQPIDSLVDYHLSTYRTP